MRRGKRGELHWIFWGAKCICRCVRCDAVCKPLKSQEWTWQLLQNQYLPEEDWKFGKREGDDCFCRPCFLKIQREQRTLRKIYEVKDLIRKINRTKPNGTDQDHRTASPVSR